RLRADPRRVGDPLRDRQEESVERLDGDRLEPPAGRGGSGAQRAGGVRGDELLRAPHARGAEGGRDPRLGLAPLAVSPRREGALVVCGQLVNSIPELDAKPYASTQVVD